MKSNSGVTTLILLLFASFTYSETDSLYFSEKQTTISTSQKSKEKFRPMPEHNDSIEHWQRYFSTGYEITAPFGSGLNIAIGKIGEENFFWGLDVFGGRRGEYTGNFGGFLSWGRRAHITHWFQIISGASIGFMMAEEEYGHYRTYQERKWGGDYWYYQTVTRWESGSTTYICPSIAPFAKFLFGKDENWGEFSYRQIFGIDVDGSGLVPATQIAFKFTHLLIKSKKKN